MPRHIDYGIDVYLARLSSRRRGQRVGLVANQTSLTSSLEYSHVQLARRGGLHMLFSPQHGFFGVEQANMIESPDEVDPLTGVRIVSLYSSTRTIDPGHLRELDALLFDLQDVGSRYYTYLWTLYYCMEACERTGTKLVVFDRPNPINGVDVEGSSIEPGFTSFVGLFPVPHRYGLTIGEFAVMLKELKFPDVKLEVVKMRGWKRNTYFDEYTNQWLPASPNIPAVSSAVVYPGMCLFEGTNLSEGRGTTRPFEVCGAPFIDPKKLCDHLAALKLPGILFRPTFFKPTFDKFAGQVCGGVFLHVTKRTTFKPVRTAMSILAAVKELYPQQFAWYGGAYEYEQTKPAIDILFGSDALRTTIDEGKPLKDIVTSCKAEERKFARRTHAWRLYR
ncbi:MAG: DUF1343 domain-containing protein [Ignavibacteriae bacterium]|nr:DUF1343 domain-containing protein [Ignavibacteriota bacterium]